MPHPPLAGVGKTYHVLNRSDGPITTFHKDPNYEAFERALEEGHQKHPVARLITDDDRPVLLSVRLRLALKERRFVEQ